MICEEDVKRIKEAKSCNSCKDWHHICQAECCKVIAILTDSNNLRLPGTYLKVRQDNLTQSMINYYRLHDVRYRNKFLWFNKKRIITVGRKMLYFHPCSLLEGNLCKTHPNKPEICKILTLDNKFADGTILTDNCLFKYKEVQINEE